MGQVQGAPDDDGHIQVHSNNINILSDQKHSSTESSVDSTTDEVQNNLDQMDKNTVEEEEDKENNNGMAELTKLLNQILVTKPQTECILNSSESSEYIFNEEVDETNLNGEDKIIITDEMEDKVLDEIEHLDVKEEFDENEEDCSSNVSIGSVFDMDDTTSSHSSVDPIFYSTTTTFDDEKMDFLAKLLKLHSIYQILEDNNDKELCSHFRSSLQSSMIEVDLDLKSSYLFRLVIKLLEKAPYVSVILARCDTLINHEKNKNQKEQFLLCLSEALIICANEYQQISLNLFQNIWKQCLNQKSFDYYSVVPDIVKKIVLSIRDVDLAQDFLLAVFPYRKQNNNIKRQRHHKSNKVYETIQDYFDYHTLGSCMNYIWEAHEKCPVDWTGRFIEVEKDGVEPLRPIFQNLKVYPLGPTEGEITIKDEHIFELSLRNGDHCRLRRSIYSTSNHPSCTNILDIVVKKIIGNEVTIVFQQKIPKDLQDDVWDLYPCSSPTTLIAMLEAIQYFVVKKSKATASYSHILNPSYSNLHVGGLTEKIDEGSINNFLYQSTANFNESQRKAIKMAINNTTSLIWGPPGTGKTTMIVQIILSHLKFFPGRTILVTASTHNATDNILEKFLEALNYREDRETIVDLQYVFRVASDHSKVLPGLKSWIVNPPFHLYGPAKTQAMKRAIEQLKKSVVVFSTCSAAGLGLVKDKLFDIVIVDEASQLTEANALIPIAKGSRRTILVGDHHQLQTTASSLGKVYGIETSLFERLYTKSPEYCSSNSILSMPIGKAMLQVQYRMNPKLAEFPSKYFYNDKLRSGVRECERLIPISMFPWPEKRGTTVGLNPSVFIPCEEMETAVGTSKANLKQIEIVVNIIRRLRVVRVSFLPKELKITVLTPYTLQKEFLKMEMQEQRLEVDVETIDGFQGRESDIIIFSTVRCNKAKSVGFLSDAKRMNVALTRAKFGLIVIGCEKTLQNTRIWKQWLEKSEMAHV